MTKICSLVLEIFCCKDSQTHTYIRRQRHFYDHPCFTVARMKIHFCKLNVHDTVWKSFFYRYLWFHFEIEWLLPHLIDNSNVYRSVVLTWSGVSSPVGVHGTVRWSWGPYCRHCMRNVCANLERNKHKTMQRLSRGQLWHEEFKSLKAVVIIIRQIPNTWEWGQYEQQ